MSETKEVLDRVEVWGEALAGKLEQLAMDHGDKAVDLALNVARLDAAHSLLMTLGVGIVAVGLALLTNILRKSALRASERDSQNPYADTAFGWWLATIFSGMGTLLMSGAFVMGVTNVWAWAGLFYPELWIAKKVIGL